MEGGIQANVLLVEAALPVYTGLTLDAATDLSDVEFGMDFDVDFELSSLDGNVVAHAEAASAPGRSVGRRSSSSSTASRRPSRSSTCTPRSTLRCGTASAGHRLRRIQRLDVAHARRPERPARVALSAGPMRRRGSRRRG